MWFDKEITQDPNYDKFLEKNLNLGVLVSRVHYSKFQHILENFSNAKYQAMKVSPGGLCAWRVGRA